MARDTRSENPVREAVELSTEILPAWNIIATFMLLAATIATLIVFSADSGRYVPTGSVMGFQGPSYFYITGFWGLIASVCWGFSTVGKLKRLSFSAREDGVLVVKERVIGGARELILPVADLKAIMFKRYPSAGHVAWLLIAIGWFAFILQFAVTDFRFQSSGFPVTGTTLLVFGGCMVGTAVIGVSKPGLHVVIIDATASHVIKMPGVISQSLIITQIMKILHNIHLTSSCAGMKLDIEKKVGQRLFIIILGAMCFTIIGIVNLGFLLSASSFSMLNQGSSWVLIISGAFEMVSIKNKKNILIAHAWVQNPDGLSRLGPSHSPRLWLVTTSIIGSIIMWYFVGTSASFEMASLNLVSSHTASLGLIGISYTSWCTITCSDVSSSLVVKIDSQQFLHIRSFSSALRKCDRSLRIAGSIKSWPLITTAILLGCVGMAFFIAGFIHLS